MSKDFTDECQQTCQLDVEEMRQKYCAVCAQGCRHAGSDQWHRRMKRQDKLAQGPSLIETDLSRYPGLGDFKTVARKTMIAVPRSFQASTSDSPLVVSRYNTPNPGRVRLDGGQTPGHFKGEVRVPVGGTVELD